MISIDVDDLRKQSPNERLEKIKALRRLVEEHVKQAQADAEKRLVTLSELEAETNRELTILQKIEIPRDKHVDVAKLFPRKNLETELETANRITPQARPEEIFKVVYNSAPRAYERVASLRDKLAAGESLTVEEKQSVNAYGALAETVERVLPSIKDEDTRTILTKTEEALKQIHNYERPKKKHEEF